MLALAAIMVAGAIQASSYDYLALRQTDGTVTTLACEGLCITFADGKLVATQGSQTTSLDLSSLNAMYFTSQGVTAIESASTASTAVKVSGRSVLVTANEGAEASLYRLDGVKIGSLVASGSGAETLGSNLQGGVYIVKVDGKTTKIIVK